MLQVTAPSITELYAQFDRKHAAMRAVPPDKENEMRFARAMDACSRIARKILATPAASDAELLLKLRVGIWNTAEFTYKTLPELDHIEVPRRYPAPALALIAALQRDLTRMCSARVRATLAAPFAD